MHLTSPYGPPGTLWRNPDVSWQWKPLLSVSSSRARTFPATSLVIKSAGYNSSVFAESENNAIGPCRISSVIIRAQFHPASTQLRQYHFESRYTANFMLRRNAGPPLLDDTGTIEAEVRLHNVRTFFLHSSIFLFTFTYLFLVRALELEPCSFLFFPF